MSKFVAVMKLTRVEHSLMLIVAVVAAELISGNCPSIYKLVLSLITPVFISMGAFAINDYYDVEVDRANKKKRPLVTGELKPQEAFGITVICMAIGIASSILINLNCFVIAIIFAALSILYSYKLKEVPLIGNAYIAFAMAIPFIFGDYVVSDFANPTVLVLFTLIFIAGLAREIDGTIRDYSGDKKRKSRTIPTIIGITASSYLAFLLYLVAIFISVHLFFSVPPFQYNWVFGMLIGIVDLILLYCGSVFVLQKRKLYDNVRNLSLGAMALALVSILISALV